MDNDDPVFNTSTLLYQYEDYPEMVNLNVTIETCEQFIQNSILYNMTHDELMQKMWPNTPSNTDVCNHTIPNMTRVDSHPSKYAVTATYPLLLLMCTVGNVLNIIILKRENAVRRTKKWSADVYLIALAVSDMAFMWAQFFNQFVVTIDAAVAIPAFYVFINAFSGGSSFLSEWFLYTSDWLLIGFRVERLIAVVFPLHYGRIVSRKRTIITVCCIFFFAFLVAFNCLVDYYWFYYHDDPRCPPTFLRQPVIMMMYLEVQQYTAMAFPLINFLIILILNSVVAVHLLIQRKFRSLHTRTSSTSDDAARDGHAIQMLLVAAFFYILMQLSSIIYNIWNRLSKWPTCYDSLSEEGRAIFMRVNIVLINCNYSFNFLLYYGASSTFRKGVRELLCKKKAFSILDGRSGPATPNGLSAGLSGNRKGLNTLSGLEAIEPLEKRSLDSFNSSKTLSSTAPLSEKSSNKSDV